MLRAELCLQPGWAQESLVGLRRAWLSCPCHQAGLRTQESLAELWLQPGLRRVWLSCACSLCWVLSLQPGWAQGSALQPHATPTHRSLSCLHLSGLLVLLSLPGCRAASWGGCGARENLGLASATLHCPSTCPPHPEPAPRDKCSLCCLCCRYSDWNNEAD